MRRGLAALGMLAFGCGGPRSHERAPAVGANDHLGELVDRIERIEGVMAKMMARCASVTEPG